MNSMANAAKGLDFKEYFGRIYPLKGFGGSENEVKTANAPDIDESIKNWLERLFLLYEVPLSYMILKEEMLPMESMRFFTNDINWHIALMDGALSPGRHAAIDFRHDMAVLEKIAANCIDGCHNVRLKLQGKPLEDGDEAGLNTAVSGFIIRSKLVRMFRGLEIVGYEGGSVIRTLRFENLSPNMLIALFKGRLDRLEFIQPPESFHFGVDTAKNGYEKTLRDKATGKYSDKKVNVPIRDTDYAAATVNLEELAENIAKSYGNVTSAEIALNMIKNPYTAVFEYI